MRETTRSHKGKTDTNHLLVESVHTPRGPRQRVICSLGSLAPAPADAWLARAHKLESAVHGHASLPGSPAPIEDLAEKARQGKTRTHIAGSRSAMAVDPDRVDVEEAREAGPVHTGHQIWKQWGMEAILRRAGLSARACVLSEAMTLNRLICPRAEQAMPAWIRRTALADILKADFAALHEEARYRTLDRLHPNREQIARELAERAQTLFDLDNAV